MNFYFHFFDCDADKFKNNCVCFFGIEFDFIKARDILTYLLKKYMVTTIVLNKFNTEFKPV